MAATTLPNLGIQYKWAYGEDNWNTGMDANLSKMDNLVQLSVIDSTISTPPGSPSAGDRYIVATGGSGAWSGHDNKIAAYVNSTWEFYTPGNGWFCKDTTNAIWLAYSGSAWVEDPLGDRAYADSLVSGFQGGNVATEWDEFIGESGKFYSLSGFTVAGDLSDTEVGTISGAGSWRGAGALRFTATSGTTHYLNTDGYGSSVAGSGGYYNQWLTGDKFQVVWQGALPFVSDVTNQYTFTVGMSSAFNTNGTSPTTTSGYSHAYFWYDDATANWQCYSRTSAGATEQTTDSGVAVAALTNYLLHLVVDTNGDVKFYINNTLVATHSAGGRISNTDQLYLLLSLRNKAALGAGTTSRDLYNDCLGYMYKYTGRSALSWR